MNFSLQWLQQAAEQGWGQEEDKNSLESLAALLDAPSPTFVARIYKKQSIRKLPQENKCFSCCQTETSVASKNIVKCQRVDSSYVKDHNYETINSGTPIENFSKPIRADRRTPKIGLHKISSTAYKRSRSKESRPKIIRRRKPKKCGNVGQIVHIKNSYYKVPPKEKDDPLDAGSSCSSNIPCPQESNIRRSTFSGSSSSGYSSGSSIGSSTSSVSSLPSLLLPKDSYGKSCSCRQLPNVPGQRAGLALSGSEELWIPEEKDLIITVTHENHSKGTSSEPLYENSGTPHSIPAGSLQTESCFQHENNKNIEKKNEIYCRHLVNEVNCLKYYYQVIIGSLITMAQKC